MKGLSKLICKFPDFCLLTDNNLIRSDFAELLWIEDIMHDTLDFKWNLS